MTDIEDNMTDIERGVIITYRMADGSEINGEFTFVMEEEYFDYVDESTLVIKETWRRESTETITFGDTSGDTEANK